MKNELKYSFNKLEVAANRLEEGIKDAKDQLDQDGVIQRFEFTFELLWKTLKLFLSREGILTNSLKQVLQETFKYGLIENEDLFLDMLEDRNLASHTYSLEVSNEIFIQIKDKYSNEISRLINKISNKIG
jgi:nucleotidyltransferase substrate binding protein (TIGR01987 family)